MNFRAKYSAENPGFQLAPMVDVIFLLLAFFVSTQIFTQWESEINVQLPTAKTNDAPGVLPGEIVINILKDGAVVVNAQKLDDEGLTYVLDRLVAHFDDQPILLEPTKAQLTSM